MFVRRTAVLTATAAAVALPLRSAPTATAASKTVWSCPDKPPLPYTLHANAVTIRSKASTKSTAVGVLCKSPPPLRSFFSSAQGSPYSPSPFLRR
ncbi:hypothetical protein GCM10010306_090990 [Streptomyces umbrinus]|uniref:hypothetical protein n=1 Tax=Streptomyces umbrinus TaxID=67370 RepID=UPI00167ABD79|nr:hypothetical protein [Streptomyces umbrinus]GHB82228.1 hypothetical protein GCM10010306_090990 [Streptomyces umbrinus]